MLGFVIQLSYENIRFLLCIKIDLKFLLLNTSIPKYSCLSMQNDWFHRNTTVRLRGTETNGQTLIKELYGMLYPFEIRLSVF